MDAELRPTGQPRPADEQLPATVSELNNLLHIIAGTTDLIGNIWHESPAADRYLEMLRHSVGRAASVTEQLIAHATNRDPKIVVHPAARERMFTLSTLKAQTDRPNESSKPRILVVDDEPLALELACAQLEGEGFAVTTAENGFEALKEFSAAPANYCLAVLDLSMPIMNHHFSHVVNRNFPCDSYCLGLG